MRFGPSIALTLLFVAAAPSQEATIDVHVNEVSHRVSRYLTGACIEDVNHEIYGGIYSQMIFGESFQEPAFSPPLKGFTTYGGEWRPKGTELEASAGDGPKLINNVAVSGDGEVGVEVFFPELKGGNAGLIVNVTGPGKGADVFTGYEISLDTAGRLVLGRHRHNWEPIRNLECEVPVAEWIPLVVRTAGESLEIEVAGKRILQFLDREHPLTAGQVGLRTWQRNARFRNFWVKQRGITTPLPFELESGASDGAVSGMWRGIRTGSAQARFALETERPFVGAQSQRISFSSGTGEVGIENQGLNRWGLNFLAGKRYEGCIWAQAPRPARLFIALESGDGKRSYAETSLLVNSPEWQRLDFSLAPRSSDHSGRFALKLKAPGEAVVGYAFLQPGEWGRFKGLPDRKDVVDALIAQGITVLRYGGSMINHPEYRWKNMIGPRDRRPPYRGTWYPHSSNGWGISDFMDLCEAAGFLGIPAFNMDETPQDMADFIEYANGSARSEWGGKRVADGHRKPYLLSYLELGNEERVDDNYWAKFEKLAPALWAKDPNLIIVVGDFQYEEPIREPFNFRGAASGITTLAAHQKILALAKANHREVWFEVHLNTEGPSRSGSVASLATYIDALRRLANGAQHQVAVFELNAGNHQHKRALANALALLTAERLNLPVVTSANCLQPDGQNDNGWDQGLLFLNPSQVWLQPPGYVTRMWSRNYEPLLVRTSVASSNDRLDATALIGENGKTLVLKVVNQGAEPAPARIRLHAFSAGSPNCWVEELAGDLAEVNTAADPNRLTPSRTRWRHEFANGSAGYTFHPHSITVLRFESGRRRD